MDPLRRKDWTVLVYQGAVNNLEPDLKTNLQELAQGPHPDNVDVVVRQIDRQGTMRDYQVDAGGLSPLGQPMSDVDSAATATLADFLRAGIARYPAHHYLVVVSSHGRGAEGLIEDERKGTLVSPLEFRNALEAGREANQGRPIDMVFFDACRMMSLEMACEIRGSAEVVVGSMDRIGSVGYDPAVMIRETAQSANAEALARRLVDNREGRQMEAFGSMSAVTLEATHELEKAFADLTIQLTDLDAPTAQRVRQLAATSRRATSSPSYLEALDNMAYSLSLHPQGSQQDLKEWLEMTRPGDPIAILSLCQNLLADARLMQEQPGLAQAARSVAEAQRQAVIAQREGDCGGLTVVLPLQRDSQQPPPKLAFEDFTHWHTAVAHLVPVGSPAVLPRTWLEKKLDPRP